MYNVGIIEKTALSSFGDDDKIFERLFSLHITGPEIIGLKAISEDVYLRVLGMHAFGAGAYSAAKEMDCGHSASDFSQEERDSIFSDFDAADAYELALEKLGIPFDSGNRQMLERVIIIAIKEAKLIAGDMIMEPQNLKAFMQVLFNAGISVFLAGNKV